MPSNKAAARLHPILSRIQCAWRASKDSDAMYRVCAGSPQTRPRDIAMPASLPLGIDTSRRETGRKLSSIRAHVRIREYGLIEILCHADPVISACGLGHGIGTFILIGQRYARNSPRSMADPGADNFGCHGAGVSSFAQQVFRPVGVCAVPANPVRVSKEIRVHFEAVADDCFAMQQLVAGLLRSQQPEQRVRIGMGTYANQRMAGQRSCLVPTQ